jgi:peptidoglycan biosynthesis protein MviN/MurJ (putative lipid II flippase)
MPNAVAIVLLRCFYAIEDTITPLLAELVDLGFFIIAAPFLTVKFGLEGLAVARSVTFFIVMTILTVVLARRGLLKFGGFAQFLLRTIVATLVMGFTSWLSWRFLAPMFDAAGTPGRLMVVCVVLALSAIVFLALAMLLRLDEAGQIMGTVSDLMPGRGRRGAE